MSTVPPGQASRKIVRDVIREGLRAASTENYGDGYGNSYSDAWTLDDPLDPRSFPDRNVEYPHIVAREVGDSGERRDSRADLWLHNYTVRLEVYARSATEAFVLRGGVKEWMQRNFDTLRDNGYVDVGLDSSTPMNYEGDPGVEALQVTYTGDLYTA
jgi:hypothetical protein